VDLIFSKIYQIVKSCTSQCRVKESSSRNNRTRVSDSYVTPCLT